MSQSRIAAIRAVLKTQNLDALVVTRLDHIRYLCGFTGTTGILVIGARDARFFTDSRYSIQAANQIKGARVEVVVPPFARHFALIPWLTSPNLAVGFERDFISVAGRDELVKALPLALWAPTSGLIDLISVVKNADELRRIRKAAEIGDRALAETLPLVKPGVREKDIASELEYRMIRLGSDKPAFETIIASGKRSALPHGVASAKKIENGDFVTFDFGATYQGYVSDMTRTVTVGKASSRQKKIYNLVLRAQEAAAAAIRPGKTGKEIDKVARDIISKGGFAKNFGHGLGHGIGFYIHVAPRLNESSTDILAPGMVVTVEPGIYIAGWGGVRIEDDVIVTRSGGDAINSSPKNLLEL